MKIAYIIETFSPMRGGAEGYLHQLARFALKQGHEVHLVAQHFIGAPTGAMLHRVRVPRRPAALRLLVFARSCREVVRTCTFDVAHSLGAVVEMDVYRPPGGVYRVAAERSLRAHAGSLRLAKWGKLLSPKHRVRLAIEAKQFRQERCVYIANSNMVKEDMLRTYGVSEERILVIYNGVDTDRFHPRLRGEYGSLVREELGLQGELVVLFVAHNFRLKGLGYAIEALARVVAGGKRDVRLVVVGGAKTRLYKKLACRMGAEDQVMFVGVTASTLPYYGAADVLVHPTFYDPFANVTLEAMASGVPVITTRYNGACEVMTEGREGFILAEPTDVARLAECISLLADAAQRKPFQLAARRLAEEFPLQRNFTETFEVYEKVLADKAARR